MNRMRKAIGSIGAVLLIGGLAIQAHIDSYWQAKILVIDGTLLPFALLYFSMSGINARFPRYLHLYLTIQSMLIATMLLWSPGFSVAAALYIVLLIQIVQETSARAASTWLAIFIAIIAIAFVIDEGWIEGASLLFLYSAAYAFVFVLATGLRDLRAAHAQLQAYSDQARKLAAAEERNHLARELHDSVTQTVFGMTLVTETARASLDHDPSAVAVQLERLDVMAASSLAELRSLIVQMRPGREDPPGLIVSLQEHGATMREQFGLHVELRVEGRDELPLDQSRALFRIVQEALNNVVKHSGTLTATVTVELGAEGTTVRIRDRGQGFEPTYPFIASDHFGLATMEERVRLLGGRFTVESQSGLGTTVSVAVPVQRRNR